MLSRAPGTQRSASHCCYCWHPALLSSALKLKISSAPPTHPKAHMQKASKTQKRGTSHSAAVQLLLGCSHSFAFCLSFYCGLAFFCLLFHSSLLKNLNKVFGQTNIGQMLLAYMMLLHTLPYSSSLVGQ